MMMLFGTVSSDGQVQVTVSVMIVFVLLMMLWTIVLKWFPMDFNIRRI